ncbi:MAG: hypothetical protein JSU03_12900 [Bacteroidetes bacterium]|nr:hypothetical protein [Bacteroidota bacterium]
MGIKDQFAKYFFLKKKEAADKINFNTRMMHGINRISLFLFVIALIILAIKLLRH